MTIYSYDASCGAFIPEGSLFATVTLTGWMGLQGLGRNVPRFRKLQVRATSPPLFDIVKSTRKRRAAFFPGELLPNAL